MFLNETAVKTPIFGDDCGQEERYKKMDLVNVSFYTTQKDLKHDRDM